MARIAGVVPHAEVAEDVEGISEEVPMKVKHRSRVRYRA